MRKGQLITGIVLILIGVAFLIIPFISIKTLFFVWIWSVPTLILGIVILLNKKEDKIERRRDLK